MRKTGSKWRTDKCGRCGEAHTGYSGKLNAVDEEYVVCGPTGKPIKVGVPTTATDVAFATTWHKEEQ